MSKRLLALFPLSLSLLIVPDYAAAQGQEKAVVLNACYAEAQWPGVSSSAYVYGNARQREQKINRPDREVYAMRRLCYRLSTETASFNVPAAPCADLIADTLKRHGKAATAHAARQKDLCQQLSGKATLVDGL